MPFFVRTTCGICILASLCFHCVYYRLHTCMNHSVQSKILHAVHWQIITRTPCVHQSCMRVRMPYVCMENALCKRTLQCNCIFVIFILSDNILIFSFSITYPITPIFTIISYQYITQLRIIGTSALNY